MYELLYNSWLSGRMSKQTTDDPLTVYDLLEFAFDKLLNCMIYIEGDARINYDFFS